MEKLLAVMRRLRAPDGCPWDIEQTHESLRPYMLEEAAEAVDAVSSPDRNELAEELGDVLLQVAFHSVIAEQEGTFDYGKVENYIVEKLIRRHPHVFGEVKADTPEQVTTNWNEIKKSEGKKPKTLSEQVPSGLGALARATEIQKKMNAETGTLEQIQSALKDQDLPKALWEMVAYCRAQKLNPEIMLREYIEKSVR